MEHYDITIIGGGSGGLTAARTATSLGAKVLLVDKERLGGDCLRYGCVPSKSLLHVARVVQQTRNAARLGLMPTELTVDMGRVSQYIQDVIERVGLLEQSYTEGVTVKFGEIAFVSPTELDLDGERIASRNTLIVTGSRPAAPAIEGLSEVGYLTNMDIFDLQRLPASLLIVGGGPIGVEMGQALARLGTAVTIVQDLPRILPREDPEVSELVEQALSAEGIEIVTGARCIRAERAGERKAVIVLQDEQERRFEATEILIALGRQPNTAGLNLEAAGITYNAKGIVVDDHLQTSASNILAFGDVIGGYLFTHVAAYQSTIAVRNALLPIAKKKVDYRVVPWCTFIDPEVARVGLTPQEAAQQHSQVRVVKLPWAEIDRAQAEGETLGFIKLVLAGKKDQIVGAHMVGSRAGELLGEMSLAMQHRLTLNDIYNTIHAYPTLNTGVQQVAAEAYLQSNTAASNRRVVRTVSNFRKG